MIKVNICGMKLKNIVNTALRIHINFTVLEILQGILCRKNTTHHVLNLLILFTKLIIYIKKQLNAIFLTLLFRRLKKKGETEIFLMKSRQDPVCRLMAE